MEYGCDVVNKFAFTADEEADDPQELIKRAAAERAAKLAAEKKKEEQAKAEAEAKAKAEATAKLDAIKNAITGRGGRGGRGRGGPRTDRGGRGRGGPRPPFQGRPAADGEVAEQVDENVPEGEDRPRRGRGGFGARGGRGRGAPRGDRQSGSGFGLKAHEKKDGHGKGNWGTDKDELAGETEEPKVEEEEQAPIPPREKTEEELRLEAIEAEIAKQKTYSEYKASLQKESNFKIRKAGEGAEENFGVLRRVEKQEVVRNIPVKEVKEVTENPHKIEIDFKFTSSNRDSRDDRRGGFGGRGGGRGRGGRGGNQQRQPKAFTAINTNDTNAFPALG